MCVQIYVCIPVCICMGFHEVFCFMGNRGDMPPVTVVSHRRDMYVAVGNTQEKCHKIEGICLKTEGTCRITLERYLLCRLSHRRDMYVSVGNTGGTSQNRGDMSPV